MATTAEEEAYAPITLLSSAADDGDGDGDATDLEVATGGDSRDRRVWSPLSCRSEDVSSPLRLRFYLICSGVAFE